jgi:hypothetical protein
MTASNGIMALQGLVESEEEDLPMGVATENVPSVVR